VIVTIRDSAAASAIGFAMSARYLHCDHQRQQAEQDDRENRNGVTLAPRLRTRTTFGIIRMVI
jgi:hypothetical protein